jgi:hypothetical protein
LSGGKAFPFALLNIRQLLPFPGGQGCRIVATDCRSQANHPPWVSKAQGVFIYLLQELT